MKPKRKINLELLALVRTLPCVGCAKWPTDNEPTHPHHVTSRGAGGHDTPENLMPVCVLCHTLIHKVGYGRAIEEKPGIGQWLRLAGRFDVLDRVVRPKVSKLN